MSCEKSASLNLKESINGLQKNVIVYGESMPRPIANLLNQTFGDLTVKAFAGSRPMAGAQWLCECKCGNERVVQAKYLQSGAVCCIPCGRKRQSIAARKTFAAYRNKPTFRRTVRRPKQMPLIDNVVAVIAAGARTQAEIAKRARVSEEQLGLALVNLILVEKKVVSRVNSNEQREYFISEAA